MINILKCEGYSNNRNPLCYTLIYIGFSLPMLRHFYINTKHITYNAIIEDNKVKLPMTRNVNPLNICLVSLYMFENAVTPATLTAESIKAILENKTPVNKKTS